MCDVCAVYWAFLAGCLDFNLLFGTLSYIFIWLYLILTNVCFSSTFWLVYKAGIWPHSKVKRDCKMLLDPHYTMSLKQFQLFDSDLISI